MEVDYPIPRLTARIAELEAELAQAKENAEYAWKNTNTIEKARQKAEAELAAAQAFKDAIIDELAVCHILNKEHETNARKAVQDAITWNCQVALDPKVSSDAAALVAEAEKRGMLEAVKIVESYRVSVGNSAAGELAAEWTMENLRELRDEIRQAAERKTTMYFEPRGKWEA